MRISRKLITVLVPVLMLVLGGWLRPETGLVAKAENAINMQGTIYIDANHLQEYNGKTITRESMDLYHAHGKRDGDGCLLRVEMAAGAV